MDPLSLVGSIVVLLSFTREVFVIVDQVVQPTDTNFISLQARLIAENGKLTQWMDYMNVKSWEDLEALLREEDRKQMKLLWDNAIEMLNNVTRRLRKFDPKKPRTISRIRWILGGEYERLKGLLEAIQNITEALYLVARPPPRYTFAPEPGSHVEDPVVGRGAYTRQIGVESAQESNSSDVFQNRRIIALLFHQAVFALRQISGHQVGNKGFDAIFNKLRNWAGSFLEGDVALDILLHKEEQGSPRHGSLKHALITTFVDILLVEEVLLNCLISNSKSPELERTLLSIMSAFFDEAIIDIATRRSAPVIGDDTQGILIRKSEQFLNLALDDLYDLLPVIRNIRCGHVLDLEQKAIAPSAQEENSSDGAVAVEQVLQEVEDIVQEIGTGSETFDETLTRVAGKHISQLQELSEQFKAKKREEKKQAQFEAIMRGIRKGLEHAKDVKNPAEKSEHVKSSLREGNERLSALIS
ncbi:hypothetical protein CC78DRAFT_604059 [Lojkania enalia]|uniref:Uncharacterized protein n=1 Tax=Lojkania enalia TaxID=147567 RepID=A0A9P4NA79_9PLEO|nr:hypothetical protein CC78DRAFT_604059 [Didymosphaeria enalia]